MLLITAQFASAPKATSDLLSLNAAQNVSVMLTALDHDQRASTESAKILVMELAELALTATSAD
jgi:hypothetical protein